MGFLPGTRCASSQQGQDAPEASEGKCPITTECLLFLSRNSLSWCLTGYG
jgi:hypothetical protein